ncbi:Myb-like_DNA-binding domain-containing protein [Hexamita inflata]|uniref:Myb-like DNA-binding domain-containing protein n=1 Tax=Hexamita inflata TaxID=28002 RepID=A0AA86NG46_9EUKA|nr:Myb-like DNA-binding domain-containing protein [Hexamita inflata]
MTTFTVNSTQVKRVSYNPWSDEDIRLLHEVVGANRVSTRVNWVEVQRVFPNRTLQQCKSFYTNKMKQFVFEIVNGVPEPNSDFIEYCYVYYICRYRSNKETLEERVRRIVAECCWEDAFPTAVLLVKKQTNFNYNKKLMVGTREFLKFHTEHKLRIDAEFANKKEIVLKNLPVTKEQWDKSAPFWRSCILICSCKRSTR